MPPDEQPRTQAYYPVSVDSVISKAPLARNIDIAKYPWLKLDARKNAGDTWDSTASRDAESTVLSLKGAQRELTRSGHNIHVLSSDR